MRSRGLPDLTAALEEALRQGHDPDKHSLTHGFHTYAGGLHPGTARQLVASLTRPGQTLLDPFCGAGTVLVEARLHGLVGTGIDINPIALWIASARTEAPTEPARERFLASALAIAERSEERVRSRVPATAPLPRHEIGYWDSHVLIELAGLRQEILEEPNKALRESLFVVFSSLLIKVSRQRADTDDEAIQRRIRKGLPTELFLRKARELGERWAHFEEALAEGTDGGPPALIRADVRDLPNRFGRGTFDQVITSPPYGGTYDYVDHQARRYAWWGLDPREFEGEEIGARRAMGRHAPPKRSEATWDREMRQAMSAIAEVVRPGGRVLLIMGDGEVGGTRIAADQQLEGMAPSIGLRFLASASETRPDRLGGDPRQEHILVFERS